jgi:hypothetical protein
VRFVEKNEPPPFPRFPPDIRAEPQELAMPEFPPITPEALRGLVRWARVAFAAKCGRRVQPLLRRFWVNPDLDILQAFDLAITLAEQSAAQAAPAAGLEEAVRQAATYAPAMAGLPPMRPPGTPAGQVPGPDIVRYAVACTTWAAATAGLEAGAGHDEASGDAALESYHWAVQATRTVGIGGADIVLRYDFWFLKETAQRAGFTDNTPVPPEAFALEKELATYRRALPAMLDQEGKFAVVEGDQVIGSWQTHADALQAGYERFGLHPFLVKRIEANTE